MAPAISSSTTLHSREEAKEMEQVEIDWENLGFGLTPTDYMYIMKCNKGDEFSEGHIVPYGNIELSPASVVLNYGQGLFEGLKAYRREDGKLILFRPDQNASRLQIGAERMCMPSPSVNQFIDAVKETVLANKRWIPPSGKGSLYIRPLLIGTGSSLGISPAPEYTFIIYASPVNKYFKEGSAPLSLYVEDEFDRASRGGVGCVKSITNYGQALRPLTRAKSRGFSDVLFLDSVTGKYIEEASAANVFVVKDKKICTAPTKGTILPGVTRSSIIEIARDHGYEVEERMVEIQELLSADEAFCTGTAVVVAPIGSVTYQGKRVEYEAGDNLVYKKLLSTYTGIQKGEIEDKKGWIVEINQSSS
ncbi:branched-chain-amino-acid aminotransferase 2, chloroplastic-like [Silene latifolia]|uniref:branched-chain-amino-acid aminotransferase 2, chloroplastic-like n=1 Tax=Silene latifolia TaxID=37657 RepID=UPI003D76CE85